jgi:hypothetical protein
VGIQLRSGGRSGAGAGWADEWRFHRRCADERDWTGFDDAGVDPSAAPDFGSSGYGPGVNWGLESRFESNGAADWTDRSHFPAITKPAIEKARRSAGLIF